jgi:hypothetical protein
MNFNCAFTGSTESESSLIVGAMMKPQKEKDTHMKKFSALMIGAAMVLGTAFAAQNAAKTPETTSSTSKVSKKHSKKSTKKSAKKTAASTAATTPTPAPAK